MIPPTTGKKQKAYRIDSSVHSTRGMGILEYIDIAMINACISFISTPHMV